MSPNKKNKNLINMITVQELIEQLEGLPKDASVKIIIQPKWAMMYECNLKVLDGVAYLTEDDNYRNEYAPRDVFEK